MADDFVIKARTIEHLVTFLICIVIVAVVGFFILKYTNWFCDCNQPAEKICPPAGYIKATDVLQEAQDAEEAEEDTGTIDVGEVIDGITEVEDEEEEEEETPAEEPEEEEEEGAESFPLTGEVELIIHGVEHTVKNYVEDEDVGFVKILAVNITLKNGKFDFVPQVEVYFWDDSNSEFRTRYPDIYLFDYELEAGTIATEYMDGLDLSLSNAEKEKTVTVRVTDASTNGLIVKKDYAFDPLE